MEIKKLREVITEQEVIGYISQLVSIPSYSGLENQEREVAKHIHNTFRKEGIYSELIEVEKGRYNVIAALKGNGKGKTILLTGHTDTVPAYDMKDPFQLKCEGGKLYGRGVVDMKGPLACMIYSMIAIKRADLQLAGDIIFAGVIDEEEGSLGTIDLIEKGLKADIAIVGEPTNLDICVAHRGLEWFEVHFHGKAVHGGKQSEGINAILKASNFIQKLEKRLVPKIKAENHPLIGKSSMNYGAIQGGTQPSTVAGECVLKIDRRWVPGVKYVDIVKGYKDIIADIEREDEEFSCTFKVMDESVMKKGYVHEAMEIDLSNPIIEIVQDKTKEAFGKKPKTTFFTAWSDGGLLCSYAKIPTIVFGPGNLETAHSANEQLEINQVLSATLIYSLVSIEVCK